ncbi:hypothetical protein [Streptomyces violaceusniger]|uniref:hypothetical protein n=1 Tax=Streptomyces violaceusniger TaxID=68280 RepID=UPI00381CAA31
MFSNCICVTFKEPWLAAILTGAKAEQSAPPLHDAAGRLVADAMAPLPTPTDANAAAITTTALRPKEVMSPPYVNCQNTIRTGPWTAGAVGARAAPD